VPKDEIEAGASEGAIASSPLCVHIGESKPLTLTRITISLGFKQFLRVEGGFLVIVGLRDFAVWNGQQVENGVSRRSSGVTGKAEC
jgi:hypothetical protein